MATPRSQTINNSTPSRKTRDDIPSLRNKVAEVIKFFLI
jgi:hypothetical protein